MMGPLLATGAQWTGIIWDCHNLLCAQSDAVAKPEPTTGSGRND
jgi:hypothetical protein